MIPEISSITAVKIVLFELMSLALADGNISDVENSFLHKFSSHYKIDDETFNEIRERVEIMHREHQKTIDLILE